MATGEATKEKAKAGKKSTAQKTTKKTAAKKTTTKKAAATKKSTAKKTAATQQTNITQESREQMIRDAAYYRAKSRGFVGGSPEQDWFEAEAEINAKLKETAA